MVLLVTRADIERSGEGTFEVLKHVETLGHTAVSGPHVKVRDRIYSSGCRNQATLTSSLVHERSCAC
jgi:hypothetical protein